jgi:flagellar biosynthetic protein FliR
VLDFVNIGATKLQLLILMSMRIGGLLMTAPVFSHRSIPRQIVLAMTLGLAVVLLPLMSGNGLPQVNSLIQLTILCLKELLVGILIGLVFTIIFLGINLAGSIIGFQIGFSMVSVMDPNSPDPVSVISEFWFLLATLIVLIINGHHMIISGLVDSFKVIPLGMSTPSGAVGEWFMKYSAFVFVLAVKFAAPIMITVFLAEVAMGVLARTMPQMNIFIVGFPVKIFVGLFMIAVSLPAFSYLLTKVCANADRELAHLMRIYNVSGVL